jgi:hypothetical protein
VPVLSTLAKSSAVCDRWFASSQTAAQWLVRLAAVGVDFAILTVIIETLQGVLS